MNDLIFRTILLFGLLLSPAARAYGPVERGRSVYIYKDCRSCHGDSGAGDRKQLAPNIAGRELWYLESQLLKFRNDIRGTHAKDKAGRIMAPVSKTLTEAEISDVSAYIASLPTRKPENELKPGNYMTGRKLYATCTVCHGAGGEGNALLKAPRLRQLNDWYLMDQMKKFRNGQRGAHPKDAEGALMVPFAQALTDQQAILDLVTYIRTLK